jgi:hypothetical protein
MENLRELKFTVSLLSLYQVLIRPLEPERLDKDRASQRPSHPLKIKYFKSNPLKTIIKFDSYRLYRKPAKSDP